MSSQTDDILTFEEDISFKTPTGPMADGVPGAETGQARSTTSSTPDMVLKERSADIIFQLYLHQGCVMTHEVIHNKLIVGSALKLRSSIFLDYQWIKCERCCSY